MELGLDQIYEAEKNLSTTGQWVEADNQRLHLFVPLEIDGVVLEGLALRGRATKDRPDEEVMLQLEFPQAKRRERGIERVDWRPLHIHNNLGRGPAEFRFLQQSGSHHHVFELNWLAEENRMLAGNLPIARPLNEDPSSYESLLEFVNKSFRINDIGLIPPPPWEAFLL